MVGKTLNDLVRRLDELNCKPKMTHDGVNSCCPAHDDKNPSFSAKMAADGKLLLKCHAGCTSEEVVRSLGWEMQDLFPDTSRRRRKSVGETPEYLIAKHPCTREHGQPTIWWYHNRDGEKVSAAVRWDKAGGGKECRPLTNVSDSVWKWSAKSDQRPLYDIHKLILLEKDELIFFVEGEKAAEVVKHLNLVGTTTQQGSKSPRKTDFQCLKDRTVIILPDNDKAGQAYAKEVSELCFEAGSKEVRVVDLSQTFDELGKSGDIADLVAARKKDPEEIFLLREQLLELAENAESAERQPKADMLDANARKKQGHSPVDLKKKSTLNDVGTARSIVAEYGDSIVWNQDTAKWMTYDNGRWNSRRGDEQMHRYIKELAEKLCIDSRLLGDECCEGAEKFTLSLCNQRTIDRIAKCCRSEPGLQVSLNQFDQHPYLLNLANGTLELKPDDQGSFHLRKHRREDFLTQISPTKYDPTARSELWEKTVGEIFADDPESLEYIQRLAGVCLTGDVSDELFHIALGSGANGKTLFFEALRNMLGDDYARPCPQNFFSVRYAESSPLELHSVRGTRLSIASENVGDKGIQENLIKSLTGGDSMATRGLYQDYTTCIPTSKFIMLVNEVPCIRGADFGITRRLRVMSFT
ncbi:MAG: phage/plasmid primase, P4 family, partial [Pirellulales bacterium]